MGTTCRVDLPCDQAQHSAVDNEKIINEMMGGGLRVLNRLADSPLVERWGLEERAQQLVYEGAKRVAGTAAKAAKRLASRRDAAPNRKGAKFDLSLSEEQQLMRDTLRRFAEGPMRSIARDADDDLAPPEEFLESFEELGATAMAIPESLGGTTEKMSAVSQMLVAEDLARGDMGLAYAALCPLTFAGAVARWGDDSQRSALIPELLQGQTAAATVAMVEPQPLFDPFALRTTAKKRAGDYVLHGQKSMVAMADRAKWLLIAAKATKVGPRFFVVERDARGVEVVDEPSMGLRSAGLGRVKLEGVRVSRDAVLGGEAAAEDPRNAAYEDAVNRARVACGVWRAHLPPPVGGVHDRQHGH
jgi:alkylation response protein AidB-like acyl-CoA dehydrogenase